MPFVTALSMNDTAFFTRSCALAALPSMALRALFTAVRSDPIAARLRARFLIILRFCFWADLILATVAPSGGERLPCFGEGCQGLAYEADSLLVHRSTLSKYAGVH